MGVEFIGIHRFVTRSYPYRIDDLGSKVETDE